MRRTSTPARVLAPGGGTWRTGVDGRERSGAALLRVGEGEKDGENSLLTLKVLNLPI